jgi:NAD(P)-dependent dehydrogenase (short-subunit alcohol dehydrogenase family)
VLDLTGKVAIVTGSTKGIGRAIAEVLSARGARVTISARSKVDVERVARELAGQASTNERSALGVPADVRKYEDCRRMVQQTADAFGRIDILVNNAGIGGFANVADMSPEHWDAIIETNLNSLFYCSHEVIPHLKRAGGGWIINIGSLAGKNAFPGGSAYNASKFGLIGFSEALMQEVRHDGIRVSYIMPGSVATEFDGMSRGSAEWKVQPQDIAEIVTDLLSFRALPSRVEVRPAKPPKK